MFDLTTRPRILRVVDAHDGDGSTLPTCPIHLASNVRRYRTIGPDGPGVYPQCVPGHGALAHLLEWPATDSPERIFEDPRFLTSCEIDVLSDAAAGLTTFETARKRSKGVETVKTQRRSILLKLGAHNMTHAVGITNDLRHDAAHPIPA
jgi:DNA-binding CsgD family transcriptional regulator